MYRSTRYATSRGGRLVASSGASEALARVQDRVEHLPGAQLHHDEEEVLDVQVTGCAVDDSELQIGRASCRERVSIADAGELWKEKAKTLTGEKLQKTI